MEIKTVKRNLNFNTDTRASSSRYRVKFGHASDFDTLRVICNYGDESQVFETSSDNLPFGTDSIYFLAVPVDNSFRIEWCSGAVAYMKRIH